MDEANDLLQNGILVQTPKGLVCMSLNDALSSDLNLSVEDLQRVASQLLYQQSKPLDKPLISVQSVQAINSSFISSDGLGDSDGFTSESSEINAIKKSVAIKLEQAQVEFSTDVESFLSSNVSDSDTSVIINRTKVDEKAACNDPFLESSKPPVKKRGGGWPKGRKRKPELLHLPPKAPSTGYNLYLNEQRKLLKDSTMLFHEITKMIGNRWSSLSLSEKQPYLDRAEEEKKRYKEELKEYRQSGSYRLYLANKRRKRAKYNVMSESDMDATDDLDEEDNEELYCRTCDQYFHNLHNKREHLQGRQHMHSVVGAIHRELVHETEPSATLSTALTSTSSSSNTQNVAGDKSDISQQMEILLKAVTSRESQIKSLTLDLSEKKCNNVALTQQLSQLRERENKLRRELSLLKSKEKDMEQKVVNLWQVPSWFVITNVNDSEEN